MSATHSPLLDASHTAALPHMEMEPCQDLSSRTAMHLAHLSNMKLDAEIFSSRSLSIQRRILIKNFLTVLYQVYPIEWLEDEAYLDREDEWIEQGSAGVADSDASSQDYEHGYDHYGYVHYDDDDSQGYYESNSNGDHDSFELEHESVLSPAIAAAALAVTRRRPQSRRPNKERVSRPVSTELPVALQSYLSSVFDVDWSVGLASTEDSLYTSKPTSQSSSRLSMSLASSSQPSSRLSISSMPSSLTSALETPFTSTSSYSPKASGNQDGFYEGMNDSQSSLHGKSTGSYDPYGKTEYEGDYGANPSYLHAQSFGYPSNGSSSHYNGNINYYQAGPDNGHLQRSLSLTNPNTSNDSGTHVHNHFHFHIHGYESDNVRRSHSSGSKNIDRSYTPPVVRSARYPKPEPRQEQQSMSSTSPPHVPRIHGQHSPWTTPKEQQWTHSVGQPHMTLHPPVPPATITMAGPHIPQPTTSSSSAVYPPEKSATFLSNPGEEQPYLATLSQLNSRYVGSQPPPPYTPSAEDTPKSQSNSRSVKKLQMPSFRPPIFTTKPQAPVSSSATDASNQRLIEHQQYQERQKMFVRNDDNKEERRSTENLSFLRQLFRQNSKKKGIAFISAPLPVGAPSSSSTH